MGSAPSLLRRLALLRSCTAAHAVLPAVSAGLGFSGACAGVLFGDAVQAFDQVLQSANL
jgi:hypothetical protein